MWRTPSGERVLRGGEARLFAAGVLRLLPRLGSATHSPNASAKAFYRLSRDQQLLILCQVVEALLRRSIPPPDRTAANEAAIAAVFDGVRQALADEIDADVSGADAPTASTAPLRRLIRRVLRRHCEQATVPPQRECDIDEWEDSLEEIKDLILWDRDFEDDIPSMMPPATAEVVMSLMRIDPGYFAPAPAGAPEPLAALLEERIRAVCEAIV